MKKFFIKRWEKVLTTQQVMYEIEAGSYEEALRDLREDNALIIEAQVLEEHPAEDIIQVAYDDHGHSWEDYSYEG